MNLNFTEAWKALQLTEQEKKQNPTIETICTESDEKLSSLNIPCILKRLRRSIDSLFSIDIKKAMETFWFTEKEQLALGRFKKRASESPHVWFYEIRFFSNMPTFRERFLRAIPALLKN